MFGAGRSALSRGFIEEGFDGLLRDKTRPSRIKPLGVEAAERVVALTLAEPPGETTHWTGALMSKAAGLSVSSVQRIWRAHGLQPHRMRQFKPSNDPRFVDKLRDAVGLYVDPPAHAIVLSVDEKSQIQALDRTQPGLPLKKGRAGTMTHDYERHGTTTLFAAMNVLDGTVIGRTMQRHRHQEFIRFLNVIEKQVPAGKMIHAIVDNYAANKHPNVRRWLERHPRWRCHFTPTSASWLNAVEGFFATLTRRRLKRGVFRSVADLQAAINRFLDHNQQSQPFTWTADPDKIIAAVRRGHQALDSIHSAAFRAGPIVGPGRFFGRCGPRPQTRFRSASSPAVLRDEPSTRVGSRASPEELSDIALVEVDAEPLGDDALEVDPPPAHEAVLLTIRPGLDEGRERGQLLRRQAGLRAVRPIVDQALQTRGVEAMHPVAQGLAIHAADTGRRSAIHPVPDSGQRQKPPALIEVLRPAGQGPKPLGRIVLSQSHR